MKQGGEDKTVIERKLKEEVDTCGEEQKQGNENDGWNEERWDKS